MNGISTADSKLREPSARLNPTYLESRLVGNHEPFTAVYIGISDIRPGPSSLLLVHQSLYCSKQEGPLKPLSYSSFPFQSFTLSIRLPEKMRATLWFPLLFLVYVGCSSAAGPPITDESLKEVAASLKMYVDELPQMPRLRGYSIIKGSFIPAKLTIGMYEKYWKFHRDLPPTKVFVYGTCKAEATFPGPAIEAIQGVPLSVTWLNFLPRRHILPWDPTIPTAIPKRGGVPTVVHLHSGVNPPHSDGSALAWFTAGFKETGPAWDRATYTYPNVQHSGNLWYHDHALGMIPANLLAGLLGTYTVRNPALDAKLNLPSGVEFDRWLVIADRSFTKDGSLYLNATGVDPAVHPQWHPEFFGDVITVNGKAWPYMKVQKRKYRLRILNAGNARYLGLSLSNGLPFTVVASDSSYLPQPVVTSRLLLSPSEIADVIVDFSKSNAREIELLNDAPYPFPGGNEAGELDGKVMKFVVLPGSPRPADYSTIPRKLVSYSPASLKDVTKTRYITLYEEISNVSGQPVQLYINGLTLLDPVTEIPKPGTTELWNVINLTEDNHPLHIHLASFRAVKVQGLLELEAFKSCMVQKKDALKCNVGAHAAGGLVRIPEYEKTWKNAVKIEPGNMTSVIVKFSLVEGGKPFPFDATAEPGYVYHCHILDHEGNGMIRPLKLVS